MNRDEFESFNTLWHACHDLCFRVEGEIQEVIHITPDSPGTLLMQELADAAHLALGDARHHLEKYRIAAGEDPF